MPVASRRAYPILRDNYERLGYNIPVVLFQATTDSIIKTFSFEPQGTRPEWPAEARAKEAVVSLPAQKVCLQCHVEAEVGESPGKVVVRSYFSSHFKEW